MKKKSFIVLLMFLFSSTLSSQTTFNKEIWPMKFISAFGPLLTKEDTIICIGYGTDYYSYSDYHPYVAKYDMEGNFISRYVDYSKGDYYYQFMRDAYWEGDSIITVIMNFRAPPPVGTYLVIIDSNTGKFIKKQRIYKPESPGRYGRPMGITKIDSVTYAVVMQFTQEGDRYHDNIVVSVVNIKTDRIKNIELHRDTIHDVPEVIRWNGEKLLVGSYKIIYYYDWEKEKYLRTSQGVIYEVDTTGTWREAFVTNFNRARVSDIFITEDGEYIISLLKIIYYYYEGERKYRWHFSVMKLDKDFNLQWEKPWGFGFDVNYLMDWAGILKAEEGDGYILSGYQPNYPYTKEGVGYWNISENTLDSMKKAGMIPMTVGILQKVDKYCDSIWMRSYSYVRDTSLDFVEHELHDVEHSPDGGYILYGMITHGPRPGIDTANQFPGWLLKVDRYGCLVPGCQDTTDTTGVLDISIGRDIKLYPNPANDKLYIYQNRGGGVTYTISDIHGKKLRVWRGHRAGHTYILDVSKFLPGVYILTVEKSEGIASKKFVVGR